MADPISNPQAASAPTAAPQAPKLIVFDTDDERRRQRREKKNFPRGHRRRRMRRHGRRAYIRSVYFLPSLATLGNAVCGFGAMYVAAMALNGGQTFIVRDPLTMRWAHGGFVAAAYLIFLAMVFDALDGRLARFTRHTTDFGGQLDSLADVISFGAAPAFLALQLFRAEGPQDLSFVLSRFVWAIGALYFSCAAIRLARFNVSNQHGEQHHFSFLGLPSPGAGGAVAAWVLMQQDLHQTAIERMHAGLSWHWIEYIAKACLAVLPLLVLALGLLMVSHFRYPHLVNRYLRGRRSFGRLLIVFIGVLLLIVWHQYTLGIGMVVYAFGGVILWAYARVRQRRPAAP